MNKSGFMVAVFCLTGFALYGADEPPSPTTLHDGQGVTNVASLNNDSTNHASTASETEVAYDPRQDIRDHAEVDEASLGRAEAMSNAGSARIQDKSGTLYGDEGGVETVSVVGENIPAEESMARQRQADRLGSHEGDPSASMAAGEASDPVDDLIESIDKAGAAARSINEASEEIQELQDINTQDE